MKVIIAGSRSGFSIGEVEHCMERFALNTIVEEVVSGTAIGVDRLGEEYAKRRNIPIKRFPADWDTYGKSAGYIRNGEMAKYGDVLLALWDGQSKGTQHMINLAKKQGIIVYVYQKEESE